VALLHSVPVSCFTNYVLSCFTISRSELLYTVPVSRALSRFFPLGLTFFVPWFDQFASSSGYANSALGAGPTSERCKERSSGRLARVAAVSCFTIYDVNGFTNDALSCFTNYAARCFTRPGTTRATDRPCSGRARLTVAAESERGRRPSL